jgi:hypothetical protein
VTRPAHRPARPPRPRRTPTQLNLALYAVAGRWEVTASQLERALWDGVGRDLPPAQRRLAATLLREASDQLLAIVEGRDQ